MSRPRTVVIVGAGLAGAKAAETLREEGFDGRVVLLGAERERPYERPPLSKEYLRGEAGAEKPFVHDKDFYEEHAIDLRLGETVLAIDVAGAAVALGARERIGYDRLLLATGARPRRLAVPGAELEGVCELRTLADIGMEYNGHGAAWDDVVIRGDLARREFIAFWLRAGRVVAAMNVNVWDMAPDIQALIAAGAPVDAARLADTAVALGDLLPAAVGDA